MNLVNTGISTQLLIFQNHTKSFQNGDQFAGYFILDGKKYLCGLTPYMEGLNKMLPCHNHGGDFKKLSGVPSGEVIHLALLRNGVFYEMQAGKINVYNGITNPETNVIYATGISVYHIDQLVVSDAIISEILEVPYIAWYDSLCPEWDFEGVHVSSICIDKIQERIVTIKNVDYTERTVFTNMTLKLDLPGVRFAASTDWEVLTGNGSISHKKEWAEREYELTKQDLQRGYVELKQIAYPKPGCGIKSPSQRQYKIDLEQLPAPNPKLVPFTNTNIQLLPVNLEYEQLLAGDDYIKIVTYKVVTKKATDYLIMFMNHLPERTTVKTYLDGKLINSKSPEPGFYSNSMMKTKTYEGNTLRFDYSCSKLKLSGSFILSF